ncbi:MAG TPA: RDD family protein [Arthrobacter sp.]|nr:RDD family protein [Arthrobacter sp.]
MRSAAPVPAPLQIGARLLEALIITIAASVLGLLALVPFIVAIVGVSSGGGEPAVAGENGQPGNLIAAFTATALVIVLVWLVVALIFVWWLAARGKSIGNAIFGLRLVSTTDGRPIGWGKALLWYAVVIIGSALTGGILGLLFLLSPLFDNESGWNQAWQDKMVGAVLINHRMGRDTFAR